MMVLASFTDAARKQEAGIAIQIAEGKPHLYAYGTENGVVIPPPDYGNFATMHTHSTDSTFSGQDYVDFFNDSRETEMIVLTPRYTFCVYKPKDWEPLYYTEKEARRHRKLEGDKAAEELKARGILGKPELVEMQTLIQLASRYGLHYRIGIRDPGID